MNRKNPQEAQKSILLESIELLIALFMLFESPKSHTSDMTFRFQWVHTEPYYHSYIILEVLENFTEFNGGLLCYREQKGFPFTEALSRENLMRESKDLYGDLDITKSKYP